MSVFSSAHAWCDLEVTPAQYKCSAGAAPSRTALLVVVVGVRRAGKVGTPGVSGQAPHASRPPPELFIRATWCYILDYMYSSVGVVIVSCLYV